MVAYVAYQGQEGAFSHQAALEACPDLTPISCATFEDAANAVLKGKAKQAILPIENSIHGRVADIHHLLPNSGLRIIGEHFLRVKLVLLGCKGSKLADIEEVFSHSVALGQCRKFTREHNIKPIPSPDTAGSAAMLAHSGKHNQGAVASALSAEIYGLTVLADEIEDHEHNTTRFLITAHPGEEEISDEFTGQTITSFVFRVRNVPAALYKAMGGFATNKVNLVKLESYMLDGSFTATQFYADIEGNPKDEPVALALEELDFFTDYHEILGVYPADDFRLLSGKDTNGQ